MKKYRNTKSVRKLLAAFEDESVAISVKELIEQNRELMNKTTVYRILDRLEVSGVLHSFIGKDGLKWYAKGTESKSKEGVIEHPHFQCDECGKSECLNIDINIPSSNKHKIETANLLLTGTCEDCL